MRYHRRCSLHLEAQWLRSLPLAMVKHSSTQSQHFLASAKINDNKRMRYRPAMNQGNHLRVHSKERSFTSAPSVPFACRHLQWSGCKTSVLQVSHYRWWLSPCCPIYSISHERPWSAKLRRSKASSHPRAARDKKFVANSFTGPRQAQICAAT